MGRKRGSVVDDIYELLVPFGAASVSASSCPPLRHRSRTRRIRGTSLAAKPQLLGPSATSSLFRDDAQRSLVDRFASYRADLAR